MAKLNIQYKSIDELIPYVRNSRTHSEEQVLQIASSIREFGWTNPVLVDGENGIIAGHGRVLAARKLGIEQIPTIELSHLSDAQKKAYVIADNRLAEQAGWDDELLKLELQELKDLDFDITLTGFDLSFLDEEEKEYEADQDEVPDVPDVVISKYGDIWQLGEHKLMCGDATNLSDVKKLMGGEMADMVWTDPPYNVAIQGKAGTIMNDDMSSTDFRQFMSSVYQSYYEFMRPGAVIYVAHADSERVIFTDCFVNAGLKLSQVLIWAKQSATLSRQDFNWQHEPILYGWKEGAGHYFCGNFKLTTVINHDRPTKSELHPTMKPIDLIADMISWSSNPGEVVLDLFGGSGTTLVACDKIGRKARLMELDPKYCDVIITRWETLTGLKAERYEDKDANKKSSKSRGTIKD